MFTFHGMEFWYLVFGIPILGIASGMFSNWLKFREAQRKLGASTSELEAEMEQVQRTNQELLDRMQNLEAIVVSQTWGVIHDKELPTAQREIKLASAAHRELAPEDSSVANRQRAEQLASRLR
jgi:uncharacterized protein YcaQ